MGMAYRWLRESLLLMCSHLVKIFLPKSVLDLQFWHENMKIFQNLFQVAYCVLYIPASSAASGRLFSTVSRLLVKRRTYYLVTSDQQFSVYT